MPVAYKAQALVNSFSNEATKYNLEAGRLESFGKSWPHPDDSDCSKKRMAQAGFYHTGHNDCVKCFLCRIKLEDWEPSEDEPWQKHAAASPNCQWAKVGKEEAQLTLDQWIDMLCDQATHTLESKLTSVRLNLRTK